MTPETAKSLLGRRALVAVKDSNYGPQKVVEWKVTEVSPSGVWIKVMDDCGRRFWKATAEITVVETLAELPARGT